jgi:hypothetical protein
MEFPKNKIYRSESYKAYVRTLPCIVCGNPSDPHHEIGGGTGLKGSDLFCIPLCRDDHQGYHVLGAASFWEMHNMDRWRAVAETLAGYVERMEGSE